MHAELKAAFMHSLNELVSDPIKTPDPLIEMAEAGLAWKPRQRRLFPYEADQICALSISIRRVLLVEKQDLAKEDFRSIVGQITKILS